MNWTVFFPDLDSTALCFDCSRWSVSGSPTGKGIQAALTRVLSLPHTASPSSKLIFKVVARTPPEEADSHRRRQIHPSTLPDL